MSTRTDLIIRALDLLGVTQVGQDPAAEDRLKVDSFVDKTVKILADERVALIDPTNISDGVFEQFATVLANMVAPSFGQPRDRATIDADKDALRITQAAEGGAFSRRRSEFTAVEQRALQENRGFSGVTAREVAGGPGFAGSASRALARSDGFTGSASRSLTASPGCAGTSKSDVAPSSNFAGTVKSDVAPSSTFAGTGKSAPADGPGFTGIAPRPLNPSPGFSGSTQRPLQGSK